MVAWSHVLGNDITMAQACDRGASKSHSRQKAERKAGKAQG
jgi:hypothetical protein